MNLRTIGRALFGSYFVYSGIKHFVHEKDLAKYAKSKHIPAPDAAVIASGVALVLGGASIALSVKPKLGAASVIGFLATVTPAIHRFWQEEDANERMHDTVDFSKNIALLCSALAVAGAERP